jgi:hypothetical protein
MENMRSKFDIITEVITGVRGNNQKNIEAVAKQVHKEATR